MTVFAKYSYFSAPDYNSVFETPSIELVPKPGLSIKFKATVPKPKFWNTLNYNKISVIRE
jgi:hypothetical protein